MKKFLAIYLLFVFTTSVANADNKIPVKLIKNQRW